MTVLSVLCLLHFRSYTGDVCILENMTEHYRNIEIRIKECKGKFFARLLKLFVYMFSVYK